MKSRKLSLESAEAERLRYQVEADRIISAVDRNRFGQVATPALLAESMIRTAQRIFPECLPIRFLDPAFGTGVFYSAVLKVYGLRNIESAQSFEVDSALINFAKNLWSPFGIKIKATDFTHAQEPPLERDKPNLIVCNPPYVRHHHLSQDTKARLRTRSEAKGIKVNGLMGLYGYFLLLADRWLAEGGCAVWIVPAELLDVNYGVALKTYLIDRISTVRIHRFDPADRQFRNALVSSVILFLKKEPPAKDHRVTFTAGSDLLQPAMTRELRSSVLDVSDKWSRFFIKGKVARLTVPTHTLGDIFRIKRGLASGSNSFFILTRKHAELLGLHKDLLRPILPSPRVLVSDVIEADKEGFPIGIPQLVLLDSTLPRSVLKDQFPAVDQYIEEGEKRGLPLLYLCKNRSPWYRQEHRPAAPILCTYMGRKKKNGTALRFIRNRSLASAHNVYLLLYPKNELASAMKARPIILEEVFEYLRNAPNIHGLGRVYGGGLNKVEPKELANLPIPAPIFDKIRALSEEVSPAYVQESFAL